VLKSVSCNSPKHCFQLTNPLCISPKKCTAGLFLLLLLQPGNTPTPQRDGRIQLSPRPSWEGELCLGQYFSSLLMAFVLSYILRPRVPFHWSGPEAAMPACHPPGSSPGCAEVPVRLGTNRCLWWVAQPRAGGRHKHILPRPFSAHAASLPERLTVLAAGIYISNLTAYICCLHKHCLPSAPGPAGDAARVSVEHWVLSWEITILYRQSLFASSLCLRVDYETSPPKNSYRSFLPHRLRLHGKVLLA